MIIRRTQRRNVFLQQRRAIFNEIDDPNINRNINSISSPIPAPTKPISPVKFETSKSNSNSTADSEISQKSLNIENSENVSPVKVVFKANDKDIAVKDVKILKINEEKHLIAALSPNKPQTTLGISIPFNKAQEVSKSLPDEMELNKKNENVSSEQAKLKEIFRSLSSASMSPLKTLSPEKKLETAFHKSSNLNASLKQSSINIMQASPIKERLEALNYVQEDTAKIKSVNITKPKSPTKFQSKQTVMTKSPISKLEKTKECEVVTPKVQENVDPAELPLSARRALFEQKLLSGNSETPVQPKPELLSVSAKAKLFEKAIEEETANAKNTYTPKNFGKKSYSELPQNTSKFTEEPLNKRGKSTETENVCNSELNNLNRNISEPSLHITNVAEDFNALDDDSYESAHFHSSPKKKCSQNAQFGSEDDHLTRSTSSKSVKFSEEIECFPESKEYYTQGSTHSSESLLSQGSSSRLYPDLSVLMDCEEISISKQESTRFPEEAKISEAESIDNKSPGPELLRTLSAYRKEQMEKIAKNSPSVQVTKDAIKPTFTNKELAKIALKKLEGIEEKINDQEPIMIQASRAIKLCLEKPEFRNSVQRIEAEKLLLLASKCKSFKIFQFP